MNGAAVKVYSKAKDGSKYLSSNFKVREFCCQDGTDTIFVSPELVSALQKIRDHFGKAVTINSAYRTEAHNKKVSGAAYSQHKYGIAADIAVKDVAPLEVARYAHTLLGNRGGVGLSVLGGVAAFDCGGVCVALEPIRLREYNGTFRRL